MDALAKVVDFYRDAFDDTPPAVHNVHPPTNIIERFWLQIISNFAEYQLFLLAYVSLVIIYFGGSAILWLIAKTGVLDGLKIQKKKPHPNQASYYKCFKNLAFSYLFLILPSGMLGFPFIKLLGMETTLPLPGILQISFHLIVMLYGEDLLHYFMHRILHKPFLYKLIHKTHHEFPSPFGMAAAYASPLEVTILGIATFAPAILIRPHVFTFYFWFVFRQVDAIVEHCGYDIPFFPVNLIPFHGGVPFHDYHHESFLFNYGSRFTYLDKLFGTYKMPQRRQEVGCGDTQTAEANNTDNNPQPAQKKLRRPVHAIPLANLFLA